MEVLDDAFPQLEELNLSENEDISDEIVPYLCEKRSHLLKLWLYRTSIQAYGYIQFSMRHLSTFGYSRSGEGR